MSSYGDRRLDATSLAAAPSVAHAPNARSVVVLMVLDRIDSSINIVQPAGGSHGYRSAERLAWAYPTDSYGRCLTNRTELRLRESRNRPRRRETLLKLVALQKRLPGMTADELDREEHTSELQSLMSQP